MADQKFRPVPNCQHKDLKVNDRIVLDGRVIPIIEVSAHGWDDATKQCVTPNEIEVLLHKGAIVERPVGREVKRG